MIKLQSTLSVIYIASCMGVSYLGSHFEHYTGGLSYLGPDGSPLLCRLQEGSSADSDVAFFSLITLIIPAIIRLTRFNRACGLFDVCALMASLLLIWLVWLDAGCGNVSLTADQNPGYFLALTSSIIGISGSFVALIFQRIVSRGD